METYKFIAIGINKYRFLQSLSYAQADAHALQQFLLTETKLTPQQTLLLTDSSPQIEGQSTYPNRANILTWLQHQPSSRRTLKLNDERLFFWFFFSGYGVNYNGEDYLMPIDGNPEDIPGTAINCRFLLETLKEHANGKILAIFDINRSSGAIGGSFVGKRINELANAMGIAAILSCQHKEFSHEVAAIGHGMFAGAFLEALRFYRNQITLADLGQYLPVRMRELSEHHWRPLQTPIIISPSLEVSQQPLLPSIQVTKIKWDKLPPIAKKLERDRHQNLPQVSIPNGAIKLNGRQSLPRNPTNSSFVPLKKPVNNAIPDGSKRLGETPKSSSIFPPSQSAQNVSNFIQNGLPPRRIVPPPELAKQELEEPNKDFDIDNYYNIFEEEIGVDDEEGEIPILISESQPSLKVSEQLLWLKWTVMAIAPLLAMTILIPQFLLQRNARIEKEPTKTTNLSTSNITDASSTFVQKIGNGELDLTKVDLNINQATSFSKAIAEARKIKPEAPLYPQAQENINRWSNVILDIAQGRAKKGDLNGAIAAAKLIETENVQIYPSAQKAIKQWEAQMEKLRINLAVIDAASRLVIPYEASSYNRAITTLRAIPREDPGFVKAKQIIDKWSEEIYKLAQTRAKYGHFELAIQTASLVPDDAAIANTVKKAIAEWKKSSNKS
jgi:hypothetical protein